MRRLQSELFEHSSHLRNVTVIGGVLVGSIVGMMGGCDREEIHAYRVARVAEIASDSHEGHDHSAEPQVVWTVPDSWEATENTSTMRMATFKADNGQIVTLAAFPGDVGGFLANVNRWRGQVGLDPTDDEGALEHVQQVEGGDVLLVDISGPEKRLLGTIILIGDGQTWFVKAVGEAETIETVKQEVIEFSLSLNLGVNEHEQEETQAIDHSGHDHSKQDENVAANEVLWEQPAEWVTEESSSSFLAEAFTTSSGARITLTSLGGDGGGLLGNINRWRGQVGLDPVLSLDEQQMKDLGNGAVIVDLVADDGGSRLVAAVVPNRGETEFFKLTGSDAQVDAEIERFAEYVAAKGLRRIGEP